MKKKEKKKTAQDWGREGMLIVLSDQPIFCYVNYVLYTSICIKTQCNNYK